MELNIHLPTGSLLLSRANLIPLPSLSFTQRNLENIDIYFLTGSTYLSPLSVCPIPTPYATIAITARRNDNLATATPLFSSIGFTATGSGDTLHYSGSISTHTSEVDALFTVPSRSQSHALIDIDLLIGPTVDTGRVTVIKQRPITITRALWQGTEVLAPPAVALPYGQWVVNVPDSADDFTMFPDALAPTSGYYQSTDAHYLYTYKAGWVKWRRSAIALW